MEEVIGPYLRKSTKCLSEKICVKPQLNFFSNLEENVDQHYPYAAGLDDITKLEDNSHHQRQANSM